MIVFGLGNPGRHYARTRHNLGFMVVDALAEKRGWHFRDFKGYARAGRGALVLVKPLVYMNNSGLVVKRLRRRAQRQILVVCDDCNLPLGRLRLRTSGTAGGHNGLASVIDALKSEDFPRLRVGVGPVPVGVDLTPFVLGSFHDAEWPQVKESVGRAVEAVLTVRARGVEAAMNLHNRT